MSCSPSSRTIVCQEVFDDNSLPSEEEIKDYAWKIGINPENEPHLLHFARDGLMQALPPGWKPCFDEELNSWYYFNFRTGESRWEHPLDDVYRTMVKKVRSESCSSAGEDDSKTSAKEDLKSYEEGETTADTLPKTMDPQRHRKGAIHLTPLKRSPTLADPKSPGNRKELLGLGPLDSERRGLTSPLTSSLKDISSSNRIDLFVKDSVKAENLDSNSRTQLPSHSYERDVLRRTKSDIGTSLHTSTRIDLRIKERASSSGGGVGTGKKEIPSPTARIDIDRMDITSLTRQESGKKDHLHSAQEKHPRGMYGRGELTLTGGGSMFLKSKQKDLASPNPSLSSTTTADKDPEIEVVSSQSKDDAMPKSILREQRTPTKQLWDMDPREMTSEEKHLWRKQELEEERKSVRFNLEKDLDIQFNISDSECVDEEEEENGAEHDDDVEEWNSDEDDPEEERIIAGIKVSEILHLMDDSQLYELADKELSDDKLETGIQRHQPLSKQLAESVAPKVHKARELSKSCKIDIQGADRNLDTVTTAEALNEPQQLLINSENPTGGDEVPENFVSGKIDLEKAKRTKPTDNVLEESVASSNNAEPDLNIEKESDDFVRSPDIDTSEQISETENKSPKVEIIHKKDEVQDKLILGDERAENFMLQHGERLAEELYQLKIQMELDKDNRISGIKASLLKDEQQEKSRLLKDYQKCISDFEEELRLKQEEQKQHLQHSIDANLAELEVSLLLSRQKEEKALWEEHALLSKAQVTLMENQLTEQKTKLEEESRQHLKELEKDIIAKEVAAKAKLYNEEHSLAVQQAAEYAKQLEEEKLRLEAEKEIKLEEVKKELCKKKEDEVSALKHQLEKDGQAKLENLKEELAKEEETRLANVRMELEAKYTAELQELKEQLAVDAENRREALLQRHKEEMAIIELQLKEAHDAEKLLRSVELETAEQSLVAFETLKVQLEGEFEEKKQELTKEHEALLNSLKEEQIFNLERLRLEFQKKEEVLKKVHAERLYELKSRLNRDLEGDRHRSRSASDQQEDDRDRDPARVFEKLRCEKRLLEDKYRSLKEKYIRLKTDVKISIERRKRRDGGTTTGSETERSSSHRGPPKPGETERSIVDLPRSCPNDNDKRTRKRTNEMLVTDNNNGSSTTTATTTTTTTTTTITTSAATIDTANASNISKPPSSLASKNLQGPLSCEEKKGQENGDLCPPGVESDNMSSASSKHPPRPSRHGETSGGHINNRRRRQLFAPFKSASTSRLLHNNNNNEASHKEADASGRCSPVENLRRQLQKLEDLEDQFPASTHTDTYLRYPFSDSGQFGSSELEFFRHRIHLERDSVRRAKDFLRVQRNSFHSRQQELKQRQLEGNTCARSMLDQLYKEERELTDMEVSLHRTRSLLGEKIIRLRHLEQSLQRATSVRCSDKADQRGAFGPSLTEDATLSDLSSHSGSSGFSSTEITTDTQLGRVMSHRNGHYQESSEIIHSLENLNTEIREIWEVLNKQNKDGNLRTVAPPPALIYMDMGWPSVTTSRPTAALTPSLPERVQPTNSSNLTQQQPIQLGTNGQGGHVTSIDPLIVERTRSLRDWLRQARLDSTELISPVLYVSPHALGARRKTRKEAKKL